MSTAVTPPARADVSPGARAFNASAPRREWVVFLSRLTRRRTALFGLVVVGIVIVNLMVDVVYTYLDPRIRLR